MKIDHFTIISLAAVGLILVGSWFWSASETLVLYPEYAIAGTSSEVVVSASVGAVISCDASTGTTAFGPLSDSSITDSDPNASTTMSCANSGGGCALYVSDVGGGGNPGLWNSSQSYIIPSPNTAYNATATLQINVEGYGIRAATTTAGSGASLIIDARYLQTGETVGGLVLGTQVLGSTGATSSAREALVTHKASISGSTKAGDYADTITYYCSAND